MKKVLTGLAAGALALSVFSSSAFAAVTFDSSTGTGFVGKGDVQTALGLNNAQMQAIANDLTFTFETVESYEITVEWTTGEGKKGETTHTVDHTRTSNVAGSVDYGARKANQVNGFNLNGFKTVSSEGIIPEVNSQFPGNSGHVVTKVELVSSTSTLYVKGVSLQ
ncbi:hypothetical protein [Bacillus sp. FJAT-27251]|uniref:hypothetical protein n=1 Tax=Bacillus sp. FJAT-27251 TaxID=1684142 RepID=UPI0006A76F66|nr:hypothetical protein [Bacillus sp. FJAT-27251]